MNPFPLTVIDLAQRTSVISVASSALGFVRPTSITAEAIGANCA